jgi:hypothetical protein
MQDTIKVTRNCSACRQPMHLYQGSDGSFWYHDKLADEYACWQQHREATDEGRPA